LTWPLKFSSIVELGAIGLAISGLALAGMFGVAELITHTGGFRSNNKAATSSSSSKQFNKRRIEIDRPKKRRQHRHRPRDRQRRKRKNGRRKNKKRNKNSRRRYKEEDYYFDERTGSVKADDDVIYIDSIDGNDYVYFQVSQYTNSDNNLLQF